MAQSVVALPASRKVAGSIPDGVIGIFHGHNPFGRTIALGSTQPLTEMSTRNISWGKGGRCVGLTTLPPSCADCQTSGDLSLLEPSRSVQTCTGIITDFRILTLNNIHSPPKNKTANGVQFGTVYTL